MTEPTIPASRVLEEARRVQREQGWCEDGFRQSMQRLGIETDQEQTVQLRVSVTVPVRQRAATEADARRVLAGALRSRADEALRRQFGYSLPAGATVELVTPAAADRGYGVDDTVPAELYAGPSRHVNSWCDVIISGPGSAGRGRCSMPRGHGGQQHIAALLDRRICGVMPVSPTAAAGASASAVPMPGDPCPAEGTWYVRPSEIGGPNQCRDWNPTREYYCTRPAGHSVAEPSPHVAAGRSEGVRAVGVGGWTPRTPFEEGYSTVDSEERRRARERGDDW